MTSHGVLYFLRHLMTQLLLGCLDMYIYCQTNFLRLQTSLYWSKASHSQHGQCRWWNQLAISFFLIITLTLKLNYHMLSLSPLYHCNLGFGNTNVCIKFDTITLKGLIPKILMHCDVIKQNFLCSSWFTSCDSIQMTQTQMLSIHGHNIQYCALNS